MPRSHQPTLAGFDDAADLLPPPVAAAPQTADCQSPDETPKLAGKTDVIPGRQNHMWIKGTEIGTYSGQCAEFCGLAHAQMRFTVVVESEEDYQSWLKQQAAAQRGSGQPALARTEGD